MGPGGGRPPSKTTTDPLDAVGGVLAGAHNASAARSESAPWGRSGAAQRPSICTQVKAALWITLYRVGDVARVLGEQAMYSAALR